MNEQFIPQVAPPPYERLRAINVSERIEKKNGLSYLSWAFAVDSLLQADPSANWDYPDPTVYADQTVMVHCAVIAFGKTMRAHLPVMDHRNKPITSPNAFDMNTSMQRCLVKAIALHGIGLYIYAGEDLPGGSPEHISETKGTLGKNADKAEVERGLLDFRTAFNLDAGEEDIAEAVMQVHERFTHNPDVYVAIGDCMTPRERSAIKAYVLQAKTMKSAQTGLANGRGR